MEAKYQNIKVAKLNQDQVLWIKLNTPPLNILTGDMMAEIRVCLDTNRAIPSLKAVVFEGEGKHFCTGASVEERQKGQAPEMIRNFHGLFNKLLDITIPTISLVRGLCVGGGMELATFCNFIIAETSARFSQPEIQLGVFPSVAAVILPNIIGQPRADRIVLTGGVIDAETALKWGLVYSVADNGSAAIVEFLEHHILPKSAVALHIANLAVRSQWRSRLQDMLDEMGQLYVDIAMETHDASEGIAANIEKREPAWKNR